MAELIQKDQKGWDDSLFQRELDEEERRQRNQDIEDYYALREGYGQRRLYGHEFGYREPYYDDRRRELQGRLEEHRKNRAYDFRVEFLNDCGRDKEERLTLLDGWSFTFDNDFARDLFRSLPAAALPTPLSPVPCCICCSSILAADFKINLSDVNTAEKVCQLCSLLLRTVGRYRNEEPNVQIVRQQSALKLGKNGPRILRLCSDLESSAGINEDIQISFPVLPEAENPARFALLCAWLRWCDEFHGCNKRDSKLNQILPTRLLWVGNPDDPDYNPDLVRLNTATYESGGKYIALSHCWGDLLIEDKKRGCTTRENIDQRQEGFSISELPKTFQDAIKVTRELRVLYLWIDSLCIIQFGDNGEDWEHECQRMESVFSSAYCTIAAASAVNSNAGFLARNISNDYVYAQDASGQRFYACTDIDDFNNDVEKARLNTRSWVMQERVLSRRTIFFSANQVYFECGEGVYCENLTILKSSFRKEFFMIDSQFPQRLVKAGDKRTIEFINFISREYSKRDLSVETDRCVAISGLENRIARNINSKSRYGIFQLYLHRNLLWQPSDIKMGKIAYETQHVPSWSWMAYSGGIQFLDVPFGEVGWLENLRFDKERELALITDVGGFRDCTTEPGEKHYAVLDSGGMKKGWIQYDVEDSEELCKERCVVVGKKYKKGDRKTTSGVQELYILVVRPNSVDGEYRRVGVGLIQSGYVVRQEFNVRIV